MKPPKYIVIVDDPSVMTIVQERLGDEYLVIAHPSTKEHILFVSVPQI